MGILVVIIAALVAITAIDTDTRSRQLDDGAHKDWLRAKERRGRGTAGKQGLSRGRASAAMSSGGGTAARWWWE